MPGLFKKNKAIVNPKPDIEISWKDELADRLLKLSKGLSLSSISDIYSFFKLLKNNTNEPLYRYRPLKNDVDYNRLIDFLESEEIYFSKHKYLNDPFDLRSPLTDAGLNSLDKDTIVSGKMIFVVFLIILLSEKDNNDSSMNEILYNLEGMGVKENDFRETIKNIAEWSHKNANIEVENPDYESLSDLLAKDSTFNTALSEIYLGKSYSTIHDALDEVGIACFSESSMNMPMWWHYADERRGVCLEFDIKSFSPSYPYIFTLPVRYVDILPDITSDVLLKKIGKSGMYHAIAHICMHKHTSWNYEKEWRIINLMNIFEKAQGKHDKIKFIRPTKIILGDRIEERGIEYKNGICEVAKKKSIMVTQMEIKVTGHTEKTIYKP